MTDRVHALTVVLEHNTRTDDVEALVAAIAQLRGVLDVTPHVADHLEEHVVRTRLKSEMYEKLNKAVSEL